MTITALQTTSREKGGAKSKETRETKNFDRSVAAEVGRCIMVRRTLCGLSTYQLAMKLGLDAADVESYEKGTKRISARLLLETAEILKVRPVFFFQ
jgi:ribosome-binding protein aMBF1 (putative translation factor)